MTSSPRRAFGLVATALGLVYLATLAPGVTLWDAGEFASAVESLGIPHPPGTPLFILAARAWRLVLAFLPTVVATNLLAAACTAVAAGIAAALIARWVRDTRIAVASGLAFGGLSTVWLNATETEVYSASLLMAIVMVWVGFISGGERRDALRRFPQTIAEWRVGKYDVLLAYLFALTPPLHLSAMVAAPAAIAFATIDRDLELDVRRAVLLLGAAVLAVGVGTGSFPLAIGALVLLATSVLVRRHRFAGLRDSAALFAVIAIGATSLLYLMVRASFDPAINQGNPETLSGAIDVIARHQYDVPGLWPRRAPLWLQVGNLVQYADWQFALGLDDWVGASVVRTPFTIAFVALGLVGSTWHRRRDRRTWVGLLVLVASATVGVVAYLNLKAGPSFGYGILPPDADREARERDYFFALGFAAFGLWVGIGAVTLARRIARQMRQPRLAWLGIVTAALPIALNWRAVDRRRQPAASLPNAFARATLESAPPRAVLFVAGDNDTYPLWYAQVARHVRTDVSIVTVPLLAAQWYRAELSRRARLYEMADTANWQGTPREMAAIASHAMRQSRPVAVAVALEPELRGAVGSRWSMRGLVYVRRSSSEFPATTAIDLRAVDSTSAMIARLLVGPIDPDRVDDPAGRYLTTLLTCPMLAKRAATGSAADSTRLLASRCNFR